MYVITLIALLVLGALVYFARRSIFEWMKEDIAAGGTAATGFTLADLRDLHRKGAMSDEEFERAKAQLVQSVQAEAARAAAERQAQQAAQASKRTGRQP